MFGFCDEIETAREFETCKEIHAKWPHLVEAHIDSLHPDVREAVAGKWHAHLTAPLRRGLSAREIHMQEIARLNTAWMQNLASLRVPYGATSGGPFSLTGLNLGFGL